MEAYKKVMWGSTVVVSLLVVFLVVYFFFIKPNGGDSDPQTNLAQQDVPESTEKTKPTVSDASPDPGLDIDLKNTIPLNSSDEPVRELLETSSSHPVFQRGLKVNNLIRRFVATVDNVANGDSPRAHIGFLETAGKFKVIRKEDKIVIDSRSYIRYQPFTMMLASFRPEQLVNLYQQLAPVMEEAYRELGFPDKSFTESLDQAIDILLATPVINGDIQLVEKVTSFAFLDSRLEALSEAQKHLLRMGPQNTRAIQQKLKEVRDLLKSKGVIR